MNKNITTYYALRTNLFTWLSALLMLTSAVARIVGYASTGFSGVLVLIFGILLPVAANLMFGIRLLTKGERQLYSTIGPVVIMALYYVVVTARLAGPGFMGILVPGICALLAIIYIATIKGRLPSTIPAIAVFAAFMASVFFDSTFRMVVEATFKYMRFMWVSAGSAVLGLVFALLAARKMPPRKEGDPYRLQYGDRIDGRRVRSLPPMAKLSPYFMVRRNESTNLIRDTLEISAMEKYIRQKRKEGLKHFGITHVILASYVRGVAELPGLNRFLSGQKVYSRFDIIVNMVIKKDWEVGSPDTVIKVQFDPGDTAEDVYKKYDEKLQEVRTPTLDSSFDALAKGFDYIPGLLLKFTIWFLKVLDYFGNMPNFITNLSPFHGSMFITSMGSLGIPPIYHHLYDFGNIPVFCAFGCKRTVKELNSDGEPVTRKYLDYTFATDERTVDGFYYAMALKRIRSYMAHPERLDNPPDVVVPDVD